MRWPNVVIRECALWDSAGTKTLCVPGERDLPSASLEQVVVETAPGHTCECKVDTLDHQLQDAGRVALLKVDVEGHELQVFRWARAILSRCAPIILFECEARHLRQHTMQDVFAYLEDLGCQGRFFCPEGLRPLREFDPSIHQRRDSPRFWDAPDCCNNFLFAPSNSL